LIEALNENEDIIDGTELFTRIRRQVMLNSEQTPEYSDIRKAGHDGGDFVFIRTEIFEIRKAGHDGGDFVFIRTEIFESSD
jgi:hypothetical protein